MVAGEESQERRSSSLSTRKDQVRHYVISSSSSSSTRSRSSSRSSTRSRSPKYRRHRRRHKHSHKRYHSGSKHHSRSHSRSPEPSTSGQSSEKKTFYYGTNSSDPKMIASRLFIGSLPYDITKDDIRGIFGKYGTIIGKNSSLLSIITNSSFVFKVNKNFDYFSHILKTG